MEKLNNRFFEEEQEKIKAWRRRHEDDDEFYFDDDDFDDDYDYDGNSPALDEQVRNIQDYFKENLAFLSFMFIIISAFVGFIVLVARVAVYPLVKMIAKSWD